MDKSFNVLKTVQKPNAALSGALGRLLDQGLVDAVMASGVSPESSLPMPMLFTRSGAMDSALPLAPVAGTSAAVQAARISREAGDRRLAVVLKPCEARALMELAKLNQANLEGVVVISMECLGRLENRIYEDSLAASPDLPDIYAGDAGLQNKAAATCLSCVRFEPENADLVIHLCGIQIREDIFVSGHTGVGRDFIQTMGLEPGGPGPEHAAALDALRQKRRAGHDRLVKDMRGVLADSRRFLSFMGSCLGCFNCCTACPVCYCRECVCAREGFDRDLADILSRADKSGRARLPAALGMFHLTRLAHMAHACVGCGQCSSFCPSGIPVADLFRTLGEDVQKSLDYSPGSDPEETIPYLRFNSESCS